MRTWAAGSLVLMMLAQTIAANAQDKLPWVAHGHEITAAKVGPAAAHYSKLQPFAGGVIDKRKDYSFGRWVETPARYDGFDVPAGHLLIEAVAFTTPLDISAPFPVVLRGVSVRLSQGSPWGILMRPASGGVYVLWSEAGAAASTVAPGGRPVDVALDLRGKPAVVYHSRFSNAVDGIHISGGETRIEQSLIDGLIAVPQSHNDGIQLLGAPVDVRIAKNKIINLNPQTSCLYLLGHNLSASSNYFAGGGWSVYGGANNNGHSGAPGGPVTLIDNIFGRDVFAKGGHFGPVTYWDKARAGSGSFYANRFDDGSAIKP